MSRWRIGWDLRCLPQDGSPGAGIPHAVRELWHTCIRETSPDIENIAFVPNGASLDEAGTLVRMPHTRTLDLKQALRTHPVDVLFCPSGAVPFGLSIPCIPWIHDLAILEHPEWFPEPFWQRFFTTTLVRRGIRRAPRVLAVSQATKKQIIKYTNLDPERIIITGQGIEIEVSHASLPGILQDRPYVLILGTVEPRKNIPFITSFWPELVSRLLTPAPLVIAGRTGWGSVSIPRSEHIPRIEALSDDLRIALLQRAALVLVPSLYEGFGRVAAEALTLGVPVIASDQGALPEVVQNYGQYLPLDRNQWIKAILEVLTPGPAQKAWQKSAAEAKNSFSWSPVAKRVLANLRGN